MTPTRCFSGLNDNILNLFINLVFLALTTPLCFFSLSSFSLEDLKTNTYAPHFVIFKGSGYGRHYCYPSLLLCEVGLLLKH